MFATRLKQRFQERAHQAVLVGIGVVFCLAGFAFFLAALHLSLSSLVGPVVSAIFLGGVLLIVGLVFLLLANRAVRQPSGEAELFGATRVPEVDAADARLTALRNPVVQAAGVGLVAGMLLGRKRRRQRN